MDNNEGSLISSQINDACNYYESLAIPGPSKQLSGNAVNDSKNNYAIQRIQIPIALLKKADKTKSEPDLRFNKEELNYHHHQQQQQQQQQPQQRDYLCYIRLQQHTLRLMRQEYEMREKNFLNLSLWFMIGNEYSNCCADIVKTVSENLNYLSLIKGLSEHLDVIERERKFRLLSAYNLLFILRECLKRTCNQLDQIYQQSVISVPACQQLLFFNQDFKTKIKFIEQFTTTVKCTMDVLFKEEVTKND